MRFDRFSRREALASIAVTALCGAQAQAQDASGYPSKPVRIVVPFTAGGSSDVLGRIVAEKLSVSLGQPVLVENKAGAAAILGTNFVAKAPPDGYTLLVATSTPTRK